MDLKDLLTDFAEYDAAKQNNLRAVAAEIKKKLICGIIDAQSKVEEYDEARASTISDAEAQLDALRKELEEAKKHEAMCHCGTPIREHTQFGSCTSPREMTQPCPLIGKLDYHALIAFLENLECVYEDDESDTPPGSEWLKGYHAAIKDVTKFHHETAKKRKNAQESLARGSLEAQAWELYCKVTAGAASARDFWHELTKDVQKEFIDRVKNMNKVH